MKVKFNEDQKKAIEATGNVLVSAAAGSGKSAVLVQKIINNLCDESKGIKANEILIVTFTRKAAEELRLKILKALKEAYYANKTSYLKEQVALINSAQISTIDSFCQKIVRDNYKVLDKISGDFEIFDTFLFEIRKKEILKQFIKDKFNGSDKDNFVDFAKKFKSEENTRTIEKSILDLYEKSRSRENPKVWLESLSSNLDNLGDEVNVIYDSAANDIKETLKKYKDEILPKIKEYKSDFLTDDTESF